MRAILTYHSIDGSGSPISISREDFRRHADFLAGGRVKVVPLEEILRVPSGEDAAAITFDDGFESFAREAWPLLRERGLPATLFVVADRAGTTNGWEGAPGLSIPVLPLLGWDELRRLAGEGLDLGAHGRTHARLPGLPPERLRDEVRGSRERIERETGRAPRTFAYPFGACDEAGVAEARAHFDLACTAELGTLSPGDDRHRLPRLDAYYLRAPGRLESWGTPAFRAFLAWRGALRRVGKVVRSIGRG